MGQINLPPSGIHRDDISDYCQQYTGDPLKISVRDAGFVAVLPTGAFSPDIPVGLFAQNQVLGPFNPTTNNTSVILAYFDLSSQKLYLTRINIQSTCPKKATTKKAAKKIKA
ncbi:MAG TPA: hypothetical protein VIJ79_08820 [Acidobacteriaceae bacterium]